jgi:MOSC domain-containing protein YiiM
VGRVEQIWLKRARRGPMDSVPSATLEAGKGVRGSANYGGRRHVTLISAERWKDLTKALGADVHPSTRRANVMVSGLDLEDTRGRILRIGPCLLRIGGETRPCERMEEAHPGLQEAMKTRWGGGVWAEVLTGGDITVGDGAMWETV